MDVREDGQRAGRGRSDLPGDHRGQRGDRVVEPEAETEGDEAHGHGRPGGNSRGLAQ